MTPLLIDNDAFCKLAIAGILDDALQLLGSDRAHCARLPALPYMLRRGRLRQALGNGTCEGLIPIALSLPVNDAPSHEWLDRLTPVSAIDPGEAQLFALAAERSISVLSGDKRALKALKTVAGFAERLERRIVVLEAVLLALCRAQGANQLRQRVEFLKAHDKMVQIAFSESNPHPEQALASYLSNVIAESRPIVLWTPAEEGTVS